MAHEKPVTIEEKRVAAWAMYRGACELIAPSPGQLLTRPQVERPDAVNEALGALYLAAEAWVAESFEGAIPLKAIPKIQPTDVAGGHGEPEAD